MNGVDLPVEFHCTIDWFVLSRCLVSGDLYVHTLSLIWMTFPSFWETYFSFLSLEELHAATYGGRSNIPI